MTAVIIVRCDADWEGFPCRGAYPSRESDPDLARAEANRHSAWFSRADGDFDLCPAHHAQRIARLADQ